MYLIDFAKRLVKKGNIAIIIYLILNVFVIGLIVHLLLADILLVGISSTETEELVEHALPFWISFVIGLVLYAISLCIALSPIGEYILRLQTGCHRIKRQDLLDYISPIFIEVYERAKQLDPSIPDDVQLFVNDDKSKNAFATGRKTICLTNGMTKAPANEIKAVLGHEFGHLANKDTDLILVVTVGNLIVTTMILIIRIIVGLISLIMRVGSVLVGGEEGLAGSVMVGIAHMLFTICVAGLMWAWTKIGQLLVLYSRRSQEYLADEFSYKLGYGNELCAFLDKNDTVKLQGVFAVLASSHPRKDDRIARLQTLGATYKAY